MAFNRKLWRKSFDEGHFPSFPCPRCGAGHLRQTQFISDSSELPDDVDQADLPEDFIDKRFALIAECDNNNCSHVVSAVGDYSIEPSPDHDFNLVEALNIKAIVPSPRLIDFSEVTPRTVTGHLEECFALYWLNYDACMNRMRTAAEAVLDSLTVPKTHRVKAKPATSTKAAVPAKIVDLDFNGRIQWLMKRNKRKAQIVDALRRIGNLASHGDGTTQEHVFAAMTLMDYLLTELYDRHTILELAESITASSKSSKKKKL